MLRKNFMVLCFIFLFALSLNAQKPDNKTKETKETKATDEAKQKESKQAKEAYDSLLEKVKKGDFTVDFTVLRTAFTKTEGFSGYGKLDKEVYSALDKKDFQTALKIAEDRLKDDYLDLNAHYVAFISNRDSGKTEKAEFHRNVLLKLVEAIEKSGDGKTPETAYVVIGVDEEYFMISYLGYNASSQGLHRANGHIYDKMTVTNPKTNETVVLYFQIDSFFGKF